MFTWCLIALWEFWFCGVIGFGSFARFWFRVAVATGTLVGGLTLVVSCCCFDCEWCILVVLFVVNWWFVVVVLGVVSGCGCSSHSLLLVVWFVAVLVVFDLCFYRFTWCLLMSFARRCLLRALDSFVVWVGDCFAGLHD